MTAINPARLSRQVEELKALIYDPVELRRQTLELLDLYADRTRRIASSKGSRRRHKAFHSPRPVLRTLSTRLREWTLEQPNYAMPIAGALWEAGYRETRILATVILGGRSDRDVPQLAEAWASICEDATVMAELASGGLAGWRSDDHADFLRQVDTWLSSPTKRVRAFALLALKAVVADPDFEDLPAVYRLLEGLSESTKGDARRSLNDLVEHLARRSPPETARFLMDEVENHGPGARRLARSVLDSLPAIQRDLLERILSA